MSFLSVFRNILGVVTKVEHAVAPLAEVALPLYAPWISLADNFLTNIQGSIVHKEALNPEGGGGDKLKAVVGDFESALGLFQDVLAKDGKKIVYDPQVLQDLIAAQVLAFNKAAELKAGIKIVGI